jgi:hypothetical protein
MTTALIASANAPDPCAGLDSILGKETTAAQVAAIRASMDSSETRNRLKACRDGGQDEKKKAAAAQALAADDASPADLAQYTGSLTAGFGVSILRKSDITEAVIEDNTLRVTGRERSKLGVWLSGVGWFKAGTNWAHGLFMGVQLSTDNAQLNSLAVGYAFTPKPTNSPELPKGGKVVVQLGVGWTRVHRLADGYSDGQTVPATVTQPPLVKTVRPGIVLMATYSLN